MPAWSDGRRLDRVLEDGAYDVLHVQVPYSPLMAGRLLTRADPRCAVIGTYHIASDRLFPRAGARVLRALKFRSAPRFDETVSVSHVAAEFAVQWSRIEVGQPFIVRDHAEGAARIARAAEQLGLLIRAHPEQWHVPADLSQMAWSPRPSGGSARSVATREEPRNR